MVERVVGDMGGASVGEDRVEDGHIDFGADESAADLDATRELLDGDEAALQQLIGLFFADLERNLEALEQAQRSNDFTTIRNLGSPASRGVRGCSMPEAVMAAARRLRDAGPRFRCGGRPAGAAVAPGRAGQARRRPAQGERV